jgi:hypothetical protein
LSLKCEIIANLMKKTSCSFMHSFSSYFSFSLLFLVISCAKAPFEEIRLPHETNPSQEEAITPDLTERDILNATRSLKLEDAQQESFFADKYGVGVSQYIRIGEVIEDTHSIKVKYEATTCTASLLDDGHVITAAHCLPKSVLNGKKSCRNLVFLNKKFQKPYRCESILWSSEVYEKEGSSKVVHSASVSADVVVYRLSQKPFEIKPMRLSTESALDSMRFRSLLFTPQKNETRHLMKESRTCQIKDRARYGYAFRVINQEFVQGNSGSPILNENDEIQFIVSSIFRGKGESFVIDVSCLEKTGNEYTWKQSCSQKGPLYFKREET